MILFGSVAGRQGARTWLLAVMVGLASLAGPAGAHEIRPAVVELHFSDDGTPRFTIATNLEALIAGIRPQHSDTSQSPNVQGYNRLRQLPPQRLRAAFDGFRDDFLAGITVRDAAGQPLPTEILAVEIPPVGDTDLARTSTVSLAATPRPDTERITWSWQPSFGPSILRVAQPGGGYGYTAYLQSGQASEPIPLNGNVEQSVARIIGDYLWIGFTHILPKGLDHILFVVGLWFRHRSWYRCAITLPASAVVAAVGTFWFVERTIMA